jgi:hypothetical protein
MCYLPSHQFQLQHEQKRSTNTCKRDLLTKETCLHINSSSNMSIPSSMRIPTNNTIYIATAVLSLTESNHEFAGALVVFVRCARTCT